MSNQRVINIWLVVLIVGLVLSGISAIPLQWELEVLVRYMGPGTAIESSFPGVATWLARIHEGLVETNARYPFIAYGTDWLGFAHLIIAILFVGPLLDPVKNEWVIDFGIIACVLIAPFAMIAGGARDIPLVWRLVDSSFGVFGVIPLIFVKRNIAAIRMIDDRACR